MTSERALAAGLASFEVRRFQAAGALNGRDGVAIEAPLQIQIDGEPFAVTMRTPGHDHELAAGLLLAEGLIESARDLGSLVPCGRPGAAQGALDVRSGPGRRLAWPPEEAHAGVRRTTLTTAACGLCGRLSVEDLLARLRPLAAESKRVSAALVRAAVAELSSGQRLFPRCGGVHAAALWLGDADCPASPRAASSAGEAYGSALAAPGSLRHGVVLREDVGRHNAVDKVIGRALLDGRLQPGPAALVVSGRCSFEMVQKALAAGVGALISVSAPTSLAVEAARGTGLTLVSFAREDRFTVYSGAVGGEWA